MPGTGRTRSDEGQTHHTGRLVEVEQPEVGAVGLHEWAQVHQYSVDCFSHVTCSNTVGWTAFYPAM